MINISKNLVVYSQVGKDISVQTSHRTVHETLASYGSSYTNHKGLIFGSVIILTDDNN